MPRALTVAQIGLLETTASASYDGNLVPWVEDWMEQRRLRAQAWIVGFDASPLRNAVSAISPDDETFQPWFYWLDANPACAAAVDASPLLSSRPYGWDFDWAAVVASTEGSLVEFSLNITADITAVVLAA